VSQAVRKYTATYPANLGCFGNVLQRSGLAPDDNILYHLVKWLLAGEVSIS
jgi:hypothetical protein